MHARQDVAGDVGSFTHALAEYLEPFRRAVLESPFIQDCKKGTLTLAQARAWAAQQFDYVNTFPCWFGLMLRQVDRPEFRESLMNNIAEERTHPRLWLQLTRGWGLSDEEVYATELCPEMQALNDFLWRITLDGHVVESAAALGVALEGMSKLVVDEVSPALGQYYHGREGVRLDKFNLAWLEAHADVDPRHGAEGAAIVEHHATTPELQAKARFAARRALEFLRLGFDGVHRRYAA